MLIKEGTKIGMSTLLKDKDGNSVSFAKSFDTETNEAEIYVTNGITKKVLMRFDSFKIKKGQRNYAVIAKVFLPGIKAYNKGTGKEIK